MNINDFLLSGLWMLITLFVYCISVFLNKNIKVFSFFVPVLISAAMIITLIYLTNTNAGKYLYYTKFLNGLINPATIAMAIPLSKQIPIIRKRFKLIFLTVFVGCVSSVSVTAFLCYLFKFPIKTMISMLPKAATMPLAIPVVDLFNGFIAVTILTLAVTGVATRFFGDVLFKFMNKNISTEGRGFIIGLSGHAIGAASCYEKSEVEGAWASLALCLNGIATCILLVGIFMLF